MTRPGRRWRILGGLALAVGVLVLVAGLGWGGDAVGSAQQDWKVPAFRAGPRASGETLVFQTSEPGQALVVFRPRTILRALPSVSCNALNERDAIPVTPADGREAGVLGEPGLLRVAVVPLEQPGTYRVRCRFAEGVQQPEGAFEVLPDVEAPVGRFMAGVGVALGAVVVGGSFVVLGVTLLIIGFVVSARARRPLGPPPSTGAPPVGGPPIPAPVTLPGSVHGSAPGPPSVPAPGAPPVVRPGPPEWPAGPPTPGAGGPPRLPGS